MTLTMMQTGIQRCIDFAGTPNSVKLFLYTIFILTFFLSQFPYIFWMIYVTTAMNISVFTIINNGLLDSKFIQLSENVYFSIYKSYCYAVVCCLLPTEAEY